MNSPSSSKRVADSNFLYKASGVEGMTPSGGPRIPKTNGCLERSQDRLFLVIQPKSIADDIEYYLKHTLLYKFIGMQACLPFLESWARWI